MVREEDVEDVEVAPPAAGAGSPFGLAARAQSFAHAFRGIATLLASQPNAWIHAAMSVGVVVLGVAFGVSRLEWAVLLLAMGLVWAAEALNTAVEWVCDVAHPERHPLIKKAKDTAAGGVLLAAIAAAAAGLIVFVPYVL